MMKQPLPPLDDVPNGYDLAADFLTAVSSFVAWSALWFLFQSSSAKRTQAREERARAAEIKRLEDAVR